MRSRGGSDAESGGSSDAAALMLRAYAGGQALGSRGTHIQEMLRKLDARSRVDAAIKAPKNGLIEARPSTTPNPADRAENTI